MDYAVGVRLRDRWYVTAACLSALLLERGELGFDVLLVDQSESSMPSAIQHLVRRLEASHQRLTSVGWWSARETLYQSAQSYSCLVQLDNDVILQRGAVLVLVEHLKERKSLAFVQGCTKNVGAPEPPYSPEEIGYPEYQRWLEGAPRLAHPAGFCSRFAAVRMSAYRAAVKVMSESVTCKILAEYQGHGFDDGALGAIWQVQGFEGLVVPQARALHICVDSGTYGEEVTRVRNRVLSEILLREVRK